MSELENSLLEEDMGPSILEEDAKDSSFFVEVNKYDSDWDSEHLFDGSTTRVVFKDEGIPYATRMNNLERVKKKLARDMGEEGEDWSIVENYITRKDEIYLKDGGPVSVWFFRDPSKFKEIFEKVYTAIEE